MKPGRKETHGMETQIQQSGESAPPFQPYSPDDLRLHGKPKIGTGSNPRHTACRLLETAHHLRRAVRALRTLAPSEESERLTLLRVRDRVEAIARLVSEATKDLKLAGVSKNDLIIEIDGKRLGLQQISRRLRRARARLDQEYAAMTTGRGRAAAEGGSGEDKPGQGGGKSPRDESIQNGGAVAGIILAAITLGGLLADLFNQKDDDNARDKVAGTTSDGIREMDDDELVTMINAMLDGPTGDDDEEAILKIIEALVDCERRKEIVNRVGLDRLLSNVDGAEWDRLVGLLADCRIISFDQMDDDASRLFVNNRRCQQLGALDIRHVRQLVLNMFSGSCGDDDEDAILKLLRCQDCPRLHQLVAMSGTKVGDFDYNFDGDQWDDLEALFAACGIVLDA
jgi:hypothetical protein